MDIFDKKKYKKTKTSRTVNCLTGYPNCKKYPFSTIFEHKWHTALLIKFSTDLNLLSESSLL